MKRTRRTKEQIAMAENTCRLYLLQDNNPHKAYDEYIKDHLKSGRPLPVYIQGIKDFIRASEALKQDLEQIRREKEQEQNSQEREQNELEQIKNLDAKTVLAAYREATGNTKLELCNIAMMVHNQDFRGITQSEIRACREYELIS